MKAVVEKQGGGYAVRYVRKMKAHIFAYSLPGTLSIVCFKC